MDIMETRFTDSFPSLSLSLQYYLYVSFSLCNFFRLLSFFFSPPHPPSPSSLSTGSEKQSNGTLVSLFSLSARAKVFLSLTLFETTSGRRKNFGVCPADSIQHLCASAYLPACLSCMCHTVSILTKRYQTFAGLHLSRSLSLSSLKFWE